MFLSEVHRIGTVVFPTYSGIRCQMMPFLFKDPKTIPYEPWRDLIGDLVETQEWQGTGYLTIDESHVTAGVSQRRPGLHVDGGVGRGWGGGGSWGGGGKTGMLIGSTTGNCEAWNQEFRGEPGDEGCCDHLHAECQESARVEMSPNTIYWLSALGIHRAMPQTKSGPRQFLRISGPSNAGWNSSNTPSPFGILPEGRILPPRPLAFTTYGDTHGK